MWLVDINPLPLLWMVQTFARDQYWAPADSRPVLGRLRLLWCWNKLPGWGVGCEDCYRGGWWSQCNAYCHISSNRLLRFHCSLRERADIIWGIHTFNSQKRLAYVLPISRITKYKLGIKHWINSYFQNAEVSGSFFDICYLLSVICFKWKNSTKILSVMSVA